MTPKKGFVCELKLYEQLDGKQCVDCYVLHKYEGIWNMLMEFSDTDLKRFEDCGCDSNTWWPITFIIWLMHSIIQNLEVKLYIVQKFKRHKIKNYCDMFRILCDLSSGSRELCLTVLTGLKLRCQTPTKHTTKYLWIITSNFSQAQLFIEENNLSEKHLSKTNWCVVCVKLVG